MKNIAKSLVVALSVLAHSPAQAAPELSTVLSSLTEFYGDLNQADLVDRNLFLDFETEPMVVSSLQSSRACANPRSFRSVSLSQVSRNIEDDTSEGIERLYEGTDGWFSMHERQAQVLADLTAALAGKSLTMCRDESTPAYSDGHSVTFIKVDGVIRFAFTIGYPD